jgi:antitoxin (DNA-binding transcriptional repressor) of toxin-antitoxin stability system
MVTVPPASDVQCTSMKRYTVSLVRERLSEALDEAEKGVPVIIERKGVRYRLAVDKPAPARKARRPQIEILDPAVADGEWTWEWKPGGLKLKGPGRT